METSDDTIQDMDGDESTTPYSFDEILNLLTHEREIILTIPEDQEDELKNGLRARKGKVNQGLKRKGIEPPKERVSFNSYPAKDSKGNPIEGIICVHISLKDRASVEIIKMEIPSKEF